MEKRKKGNKKGPKTVLIVCEGYTEENMVISEKNRRKINAVTIVNMKGSAPLEIIETTVPSLVWTQNRHLYVKKISKIFSELRVRGAFCPPHLPFFIFRPAFPN